MGFPQVLRVGRVHRCVELRAEFDPPGTHAGHEAGGDGSAVRVLDSDAHGQVAAAARVDGEQRQAGREEQVPDAVLLVPGADLGKDRERRVVDHDAARGIVRRLVVAAGVEGTHDRRALQLVVLHRPAAHGLIDVVRGIDVVGRELRLELVHELLILLRALSLHVAPEGRLRLLGLQMDAFRLKAGEGNIKARSLQGQLLSLDQALVPAAHLAELVVGQDVGPALLLGQVVRDHARRHCLAVGLGGQQAAVAGDHVPGLVDHDRRDEAELLQGAPQRLDLLRRVRLRVVGVGDQLGDRPKLKACGCFHGAPFCARGLRWRFALAARPGTRAMLPGQTPR